jgi:antitoxin (DNA-binding transcriptional repressor) of toxin-antitoxin stability system
VRVVRVDEFRQNLATFLELARGGETFLLARHGQVEALVRPSQQADRFQEIGASAFRGRAFQIVREAATEPRVVTWYRRPAAAVVGAPPGCVTADAEGDE